MRLFLSGLLLLTLGSCAQVSGFRHNIDIRLRSVGIITGHWGIVSCVAIGPHLVLTTRHGPVSADSTIVIDGRELYPVGWYESPDCDLRIFRVEETLGYVQLSRHPPLLLEEVFVVGSPFGPMNYNTVSRGIVCHPRRDIDGHTFIQIDVAAGPGSSGGPVLDHKGRLAGIIKAHVGWGAFFYAEPLDHIREAIRSFESAETCH